MRTNTTTQTNAIALKAIAILAMLAFALFLTGGLQQAHAAEMLNANQKGSITISPEAKGGNAVSGTFEIYKVADALADNSGWHFEWAKGYEGTDHALYDKTGELDDTYKSNLLKLLKDKVKAQKPTQKSKSSSQTATFSNLSVGLYYVEMTDVQKGYETIDPFLVTVPTADANGNLTYDVVANTKAGNVAKKTNPNPTPPSETTKKKTEENPTPSSTSTTTASKTLPQTGQLWWPVFVLAIAGAALVIAGVARRRSGKNGLSR